MKLEHKVESLNNCINQQQAYAQLVGLENTTDMLNLEENKFDYKKISSWKKKPFEKLKFEAFMRWEK